MTTSLRAASASAPPSRRSSAGSGICAAEILLILAEDDLVAAHIRWTEDGATAETQPGCPRPGVR